MTLTERGTSVIAITETAADAVQDLLKERELEEHALRVFIAGSGCSGYQYGMAIEPEPSETDILLEQHGVQIVIDSVSINYLQGATIDYIDGPMGSGFKIENPNEMSSCGCGPSPDANPQSGNGSCGCSGCG